MYVTSAESSCCDRSRDLSFGTPDGKTPCRRERGAVLIWSRTQGPGAKFLAADEMFPASSIPFDDMQPVYL